MSCEKRSLSRHCKKSRHCAGFLLRTLLTKISSGDEAGKAFSAAAGRTLQYQTTVKGITMKAKLTLALLALCAAPAAFAAKTPVGSLKIGTADALILGTVAALLVAVVLFRAQVRQYAKRQLNK
jgi:hypothetical protein